jgi:hypothetical protein
MAQIAYPLKQVLEVKQRRVDQAEKVVKEKQAALDKEKEILAQREADKKKAQDHHDAKLAQLRELLDRESTSPKIQQSKAYLKVAKERVKVEEKKVKEQQQQVEIAEKNLEAAKNDLKQKRLEVDKLHTHRRDWTREMRKEQEIIEGREQDELGSIIFTSKQQQKR